MTGRDSADEGCNAQRSTLKVQCSTSASLASSRHRSPVADRRVRNEEDDEYENEGSLKSKTARAPLEVRGLAGRFAHWSDTRASEPLTITGHRFAAESP